MEAIITALMPLVVSGLTQVSKKVHLIKMTQARKTIGRVLVALFAYLSALTAAWLASGSIDPMAIETFATAIVNGLAATGVYFFKKR